jgi:deoxycytidylate deaminase
MSLGLSFPRYLEMATRLAESNDNYPKWPLGAVCVKGGSVLSFGQSKLRTDPKVCDMDASHHKFSLSIHAEDDAIRRCGNPKGATLFVSRVGRNGAIGMAKPCKKCQRLIRKSGIKRVIYSVDDSTYSVWTP